MLLSGVELKQRAIIQFDKAASYRGATYDLTVGEIVRPDGAVVEEYVIPPQGLVKVVSAEEVQMPRNLVGYVFVKTSLCNEGLLALNIGIVDPNYHGPLRSALINFGRTVHRVKRGEVFSRLTVHDLPNGVSGETVRVTRDDAVKQATNEVDHFLSEKFLDVEATTNQAAEKAFSKYRDTMFRWLPLAAVSIAALTFFLNFANMYAMYRIWFPMEHLAVSVWRQDMARQVSALEAANKQLREEVEKFQKATRPQTRPKAGKSQP